MTIKKGDFVVVTNHEAVTHVVIKTGQWFKVDRIDGKGRIAISHKHKSWVLKESDVKVVRKNNKPQPTANHLDSVISEMEEQWWRIYDLTYPS